MIKLYLSATNLEEDRADLQKQYWSEQVNKIVSMCVWYIYIYIFIFFLSSKQLQTYIPHLTYKRTTPEFSTAKAICIFKFGNCVDHKAGPIQSNWGVAQVD